MGRGRGHRPRAENGDPRLLMLRRCPGPRLDRKWQVPAACGFHRFPGAPGEGDRPWERCDRHPCPPME